jgi:UDP-N-acetylglucosamine 2-epimerase (non-hydrolysing)
MEDTNQIKKIAVYTGTRAEYGLLSPFLKRLSTDSTFELQLLVSGAHLSKDHGRTIDQIIADGYAPAWTVPLDLSSDKALGLCRGLGESVVEWGRAFEELKPELLVVLGDRYELLGPAQAALMFNIPMAHIHGGEVTEGAMDDMLRHAITKMSHLHFVAADAYAQRVIQMGEEPQRVHQVGALGLEVLDALGEVSLSELEESLGFGSLAKGYFLMTFHPLTLNLEEGLRELEALLQALGKFPDIKVIVTGVNADPGFKVLHERIMEAVEESPNRIKAFSSLGQKRYGWAMAHAVAVVGNSSSGIIEAPYLGTPTLNVGDRQKGRLMADSVFCCGADVEAMTSYLNECQLKYKGSHLKLKGGGYYGSAKTSEKMIDILKGVDWGALRQKKFRDVHCD